MNMNICIYIIIILFIILAYIILNNFFHKKEHYCCIPRLNNRAVPNNFNILYTYKPQSNIRTAGCDNYWKNFSTEVNSSLVTNEPIPIDSDQLVLPPTSEIGNRSYSVGLLDFKKLASFVNDKDDNYLKRSKMLLLNPITKEKLPFYYQVTFFIDQMNTKTYKERWTKYNPSVQTNFDYKNITSEIPLVNELNMEFLKRINLNQRKIVDKKDKIIYGLINFEIIYYKILNVLYLDGNKDIPVFIMEVGLYQEKNYYIPTIAYIGLKNNKTNKLIIVQADYMGLNANDNFLLPKGVNKTSADQNFFILNKNFNDFSPRITNPDFIVDLVQRRKDAFKLENQFACFNININNDQSADKTFLPYFSRETCESTLDPFGRPKAVGIFDKPCKEDKECPFFQSNKNYPNNFGKCINNKCQLPINMINIGYHYYVSDKDSAPLCYNCNQTKFNATSSELGDCCHEQNDKKKYPFLKSPDYAFKDDILVRKNYDLQKNFVIKGNQKYNLVSK